MKGERAAATRPKRIEKTAGEPITNERHCPDSDSVQVKFLGDPDNDGLVEWKIEPASDGLACVTQNEFAGQEVTVGHLPVQFGFTVIAPAP